MKEKRYYIAYGSNLSVEQMAYRAPDAKIVGTGILYGWRLLFRTHATVELCEGKNTPILVWEISAMDEARLDCYEGYPNYYDKKYIELEVFPIDGGEPVMLMAMVYLMTEGRNLAAPSPGYYAVLKEGYRRFHFPMHVLEQALADSIGRKNAIRMLGEKCTLTRKKGKNMKFASEKDVERLRREFPAGCRVVLDEMDDPYTKIPVGSQGECKGWTMLGTSW